VSEVLFAKGHPESNSPQSFDVLGQALQLLVVEQVGLAHAHAREVVVHLHRERISLFPLTCLPISPALRDLANVDLGIEVRGECVAMTSAVAIENIDGLDFVE
jgi:hypothetical protein